MAEENLMIISTWNKYDKRVLGKYTEKIGGYLGCPLHCSSVSLNIQGIWIKSPVLRAAVNIPLQRATAL